jgi:CRISPR-associated protein Cas1
MRKILVLRRKGKIKMKSRSVIQLQYDNDEGKKIIREYSIRDLDAVLIIGRDLYVESSLISVLSSINVPVTVIAKGSIGIFLNPIIVINPQYRRLQYSLDKLKCLEIAAEYIKAKINGMVNILKYHRVDIPAIPEMPNFSEEPKKLEQKIRMWESQTSNMLWGYMVKLIEPSILEELRRKYEFHGRRPRHQDPFNKTLSIMYAVLYSLSTKALLAAGLDPTSGFFHRTKYSTPLSFDYTEMFKPVAIEATIDMVNRGLPALNEDGELDKDDVNLAIKNLYGYLTLQHKDTKKSIYQQIFLKAFSLSNYLEGGLKKEKLTIIWNRSQYRSH